MKTISPFFLAVKIATGQPCNFDLTLLPTGRGGEDSYPTPSDY